MKRLAPGLIALVLSSIGCEIRFDDEGRHCRVGGRVYADGTQGIPAADGCNTCYCDNGELGCTLMECSGKPCGGRLGDTCSENEYCAYERDCGRADSTSVCKARPQGCNHHYAPVCGCDGETYGNACEAAASGVGYLHEGPCEGSTSCNVGGEVYPDGATNVPAPDGCNTCTCQAGEVVHCTERACGVVCGGWAGNTCSRDEYCAYEGGDCGYTDGSAYCRTRPEVCDDIYAPVCGCDGKTYGNHCVAAAAGVGYRFKGTCD